MASTEQSAKPYKALTLTQLANYDDLITDTLVDQAFFWTAIRKNRSRYFACRGVTEEQVTTILRQHVIIETDPVKAFDALVALPGFKKYIDRLSSTTEQLHFQNHLRKYILMYLPEAPFEVGTTNRYTIDQEEAAIFARRDIRKGETIRHLTGIQVPITPEEEESLDLTRRDFSIVISSRKRMPSLFLGPARFANHDCNANASLVTKGPSGMTVRAVRNIRLGDEITVSYGENYFGIDNCECLCATCEYKARNGWASTEDEVDAQPAVHVEPASRESSLSGRRSTSTPSRGAGPSRRSGLSSRADSEARQSEGPRHNNHKRKVLEIEEFQRTGRSPKRPEVSRLQKTADSRNSHSPVPSAGPPAVASPSNARSNEYTKSTKVDDSGYETTSNGSHDTARVREENGDADMSELAPSRFNVMTSDGRIASILQSVAAQHSDTTPGLLGEVAQIGSSDDEQSSGGATPMQRSLSAYSSYPSAEPEIGASDGGSQSDEQPPAVSERITAHRRPGDWTLTELLLSEPYSRWVECQVCDTPFVQRDAYQTRMSCPRCERHSKLYGYRWPKTHKTDPDDDEERILDHREINRFVDPSEEKTISKGKNKALRKLLNERDLQEAMSDSAPEPLERVKNGRTFRASLGMRKVDEPTWDDYEVMPRKKPAVKKAAEEGPSNARNGKLEPKKRGRKPKTISRFDTKQVKKLAVDKKGQTKWVVTHKVRKPQGPKRKYNRTGLFSRDPVIRADALAKAAKEQQKADAERQTKEREQLKAKKDEERAAKKAKEQAARKPQLPPGLKPSKWKGYALERLDQDEEDGLNPRKVYTLESARWEPESSPAEESSDESPPRASKRQIKPTAKSMSMGQQALLRTRGKSSQDGSSSWTTISSSTTSGSRKRKATAMLDGADDEKDEDDQTVRSVKRISRPNRSRLTVLDSSSEEEDAMDIDNSSSDEEYATTDGEESDSSEFSVASMGTLQRRAGEAREGMARQQNRRSANQVTVGSQRNQPSLPQSPMDLRKKASQPSPGLSLPSGTVKRGRPLGSTKASKTPGLPKGWAWPEQDDIAKREQMEADKVAREKAVARKQSRKTL